LDAFVAIVVHDRDELVEERCARGMKWQYLLKRSTTVRMMDFPPTRGSASMKSSPMSVQTAVGTGRSRPAGCRWSAEVGGVEVTT
jgi:hypothetical protein